MARCAARKRVSADGTYSISNTIGGIPCANPLFGQRRPPLVSLPEEGRMRDLRFEAVCKKTYEAVTVTWPTIGLPGGRGLLGRGRLWPEPAEVTAYICGGECHARGACQPAGIGASTASSGGTGHLVSLVEMSAWTPTHGERRLV